MEADALLVAMDRHGTRVPFEKLEALQRATARGRIDFWVVKGWSAPEELLYPHFQEALTAWTRLKKSRDVELKITLDIELNIFARDEQERGHRRAITKYLAQIG